jgi:hypothetical protein
MSTLSQIERTILEILLEDPGARVSARDLRSRLQARGFRRSAPALVFTMLNLADKGLVDCREEVRETAGVVVTERCYRAAIEDRGALDG